MMEITFSLLWDIYELIWKNVFGANKKEGYLNLRDSNNEELNLKISQ